MRVVVNFDLCEANGKCVVHSPDVFELNDQDELTILEEELPEDRREEMKRCIKVCPKRAISLEG